MQEHTARQTAACLFATIQPHLRPMLLNPARGPTFIERGVNLTSCADFSESPFLSFSAFFFRKISCSWGEQNRDPKYFRRSQTAAALHLRIRKWLCTKQEDSYHQELPLVHYLVSICVEHVEGYFEAGMRLWRTFCENQYKSTEPKKLSTWHNIWRSLILHTEDHPSGNIFTHCVHAHKNTTVMYWVHLCIVVFIQENSFFHFPHSYTMFNFSSLQK